MSRGSRVVYIDSAANLPATNMQNGDIAIEKSNGGIVTSNTNSHKAANKIWQYQSGMWNEILPRTNADPDDISEKRTSWTDETIVPNVTKIRRAHIEDIREYLNFIQKMYSKRYGDTYYNIHDYSGAVLNWKRGSDFAKVYFAQYTDGSKQYLTLEFGENWSGDPESVDNDRIRFLFRGFDAPTAPISVFDVTAKSLISYVPAYLNSNLKVYGATQLMQTLAVTGATTLSSTLSVSLGTSLLSTLDVTGATVLMSTLEVRSTGLFKENVTFEKDIIVTGIMYPKIGLDNGIVFGGATIADSWGVIRKVEFGDGHTELQIHTSRTNTAAGTDFVGIWANNVHGLYINGNPVMHAGNDGATSGFDADALDGHHWGEVPKITLINAQFLNLAGAAFTPNALAIDFGMSGADPHGETRTARYYVPATTDYCQCQCPCTCPCPCQCTSPCDCWD